METWNEKRANEIKRKELTLPVTQKCVRETERESACGCVNVCVCGWVGGCMRNDPLRVVNCLTCVILAAVRYNDII